MPPRSQFFTTLAGVLVVLGTLGVLALHTQSWILAVLFFVWLYVGGSSLASSVRGAACRSLW